MCAKCILLNFIFKYIQKENNLRGDTIKSIAICIK